MTEHVANPDNKTNEEVSLQEGIETNSEETVVAPVEQKTTEEKAAEIVSADAAKKSDEKKPEKKKVNVVRMAPVGDDEEFDVEQFDEMASFYEESFREINEGSIVKGTVVSISNDDVLVDVGYKSEGTINLNEFPNRNEIKVNDEVEVYLESKEDNDGVIVLSKEKADFFRTWDKVREVHEEEGIITGKIVDRVRGGFVVDIGVKAFLPSSQLDIRPVHSFDEFMGNDYEFKVIKLNKRRRNIVLSRKALLLEQRKEQREELIAKMRKGLVLSGEVKNITDFGAFIDLGGMDGLLHITDLSWGRVTHPSEVLSLGDEMEVMVLDFDEEKERVSLGLKQLSKHPWDDIHSKYKEEDKVIGTVVSIVDYGAFIELEKGIEGLIHISEMSWTQRIKHPSKVLGSGDKVEAIILKIDEENQRISLGLRQTMNNPWESIEARFPPGTVFEGIVRNITEFGAFVELEEGIDGLVHISDMSWTRRIRHPSEFVKRGDTVRVVVLSIDRGNQRISLGMKQLESDPWENIELLFPIGTYIEGEIVRITNYGAIVRLEGDIEGLLHISEIAGERINRVDDVIAVGDVAKVKIINLSPKERRINLSLCQYERETGEPGIKKEDGTEIHTEAAIQAKIAAGEIERPEGPEDTDIPDGEEGAEVEVEDEEVVATPEAPPVEG